ncbi:MAG: class I adenylate-forming enzyme family protein [Opitutaceae bacterium]
MSATLLEAWNRTVTAAPDAIALIDVGANRRWTRAEIEADAQTWQSRNGMAAAAQTVAFADANGAGWLTVFLGLLKSGAVAVPLDPGEPIDAQRATAKKVGATYLWSAGELEALDARARPARDRRRLLKLTSGSTGAPRALRFTDEQMLADGRQVCAGMDIRPDDINLGLIPWGHSYGLGNLIVPLLAQGTAILFGAAPLPHAIAAAIAEWRPTVFPAVPALLRALAESSVETSALTSLRTVISAGAPLGPEVARGFREKFQRRIHSFYGSSETGGITYDPTGECAETGRSVGYPLPGVQLRFGRGKRFSVESAAVTGSGVFRPADRGELNDRGELVLLGRAGRMLKIAGRRLDPAEVERALRSLPGVSDAFVDSHGERTDALAAAVVSRDSAAALRELLRPRIASWKIPKKILALPEFPRTARGKADVRQLRSLLRG